MAKERLYTEKEVSAILKRVGERQTVQGNKDAVGLSLQEIQQIAGDVGLDPALVASVAAELDAIPEKEGSFAWLKLPNKVEVERVLPGNVTEAEWPEITSAIERALGVTGVSSQVGSMLEWTYFSKTVQYKISFSPGNGQTRVRLLGDFTRFSRALLLGILIQVAVWFTFMGVLLFSVGGVPFGVVAVFLAYMLIRFGFAGYIRKKEKVFHDLLDRWERTFAVNFIANSVSASTPDVEPPQLSLPTEEIAGEDATTSAERKKVT